MNRRDSKTHSKSIRVALPGIQRILTRFAPQILRQKWLLIFSFAALMAEIVLHLLEPWFLKFIFDYILLKDVTLKSHSLPSLSGLNPVMLLTTLAVGMVVVTGLRSLAAYCSVVGMAWAATNILTEVRAELYSHLQQLSLAFHHKSKTGG